MSTATWREEFCPMDVADVPVGHGGAHALQKWKGARKENLAEHGMSVLASGNHDYITDGKSPFSMGGYSCVWCCHTYEVDTATRSCKLCPAVAAGMPKCDEEPELIKCLTSANARAPYAMWVYQHDPEPMIAWVEEAIKKIEAQSPRKNVRKNYNVYSVTLTTSVDVDLLVAAHSIGDAEAWAEDNGGDFIAEHDSNDIITSNVDYGAFVLDSSRTVRGTPPRNVDAVVGVELYEEKE